MKSLIIFCLVAGALAAPLQQQQDLRRRLQSLSVQLVEDDDGDDGNNIRQQFKVHDAIKQRYDGSAENDDRYDDGIYRHGDHDNVDDRDDDHEMLGLGQTMSQNYYRVGDTLDESKSLRSSHLDALARQMDIVASKYGSHGRVKVAYVPPSQRSNPYSHDLGSLNFRYVPSKVRKQVQYQSGIKPTVVYVRPDNAMNFNDYSNSYLTQLKRQTRQQYERQEIDDQE